MSIQATTEQLQFMRSLLDGFSVRFYGLGVDLVVLAHKPDNWQTLAARQAAAVDRYLGETGVSVDVGCGDGGLNFPQYMAVRGARQYLVQELIALLHRDLMTDTDDDLYYETAMSRLTAMMDHFSDNCVAALRLFLED